MTKVSEKEMVNIAKGEIPNGIPNRKFWEKLFNEWKRALKLYIDEVKNDLPYWHGERANTGFLAAACWKIGAVAVEEYWTERKGKRGKSKRGSGDLFVKHKDLEFFVEAKQLWPENERSIKSVEGKLKEACKQLQKIQGKRKRQHLVAICYISPALTLKEKFDRKLYLKKLKEHYKDAIIISFFPNGLKRIKEGEYKYPGIVLIAEVDKCRGYER